jgi:biotin transport system substrate-specific component
MAREADMMEAAATCHRVMIEAVWLTSGVGREVALVLGGSLLTALSAQLHIVLPFSPVPITGQTFAVLILGALYGRTRGPGTVLTYLALGALGLPIFAGGAFGVARLIGPTGGYLVGFLAAACVVGLLSEQGWDRKPWTMAVSMIIGNAVIYVTGVLWLSRFVGWPAILSTGVLPFLASDALKIALATILLPTGWKLISRAGEL